MDTRSKITSSGQVQQRLQGAQARWVKGHFDPLLAEHVRLLQANATPGTPLVVEITNPADPYLPQQARAELVAALSMVDHVVVTSDPSATSEVIDAGLTARFEEHVHRRHRGEGH